MENDKLIMSEFRTTSAYFRKPLAAEPASAAEGAGFLLESGPVA